VVAAPPPRPPWIALEKLAAIRAKGAPPEGAHKEYYDAVSDVVREYLGAIGGFPALDLTTEELLAAVRQRPPPVVSMGEIAGFLGECDLVKFAKAPATADQTLALLDAAAGIVHRTRTGLEPARPAVQEAA
jgi:hypothetical protein